MRLTPLKKKEGRKVALLLSCPKCGHEKRATRPMTTVSKIIERSSQERIAVIEKQEQKLRTLPTVRIECSKCGNSLAYAWIVQIQKVGRIFNTVFQMHKMQLHLPRQQLGGEDKTIKEKEKTYIKEELK